MNPKFTPDFSLIVVESLIRKTLAESVGTAQALKPKHCQKDDEVEFMYNAQEVLNVVRTEFSCERGKGD